MHQVFVFCPNLIIHKEWPRDDVEQNKWSSTNQIAHPSINTLTLDLSLSTAQTSTQSVENHALAVAYAAPHAEIVLILLRALHYTKHKETALRVARAHMPSLAYTEKMSDMLSMLCAHDELMTLALNTFKYELWCTSKLHPILYNLVPFLGPYTRTNTHVLRLYGTTDTPKKQPILSTTHCHAKQKTFINKGALLDASNALATSNMYYATTRDIPEGYSEFVKEMTDMFIKMRCSSPIWKQSQHPHDERAQFNEIKTNIQILMTEYSLACDTYRNT